MAYTFDSAVSWVDGVMGKHNPPSRIFISEVARVEMASTLYKIERIKHLDEAVTNWSVNRFERDLDIKNAYKRSRYSVMFVNDDLLQLGAALLQKYRSGKPYGLRSLDAIQLASAVTARDTLPSLNRAGLQFVTADLQLAGCARNEGFGTINPLAPPTAI